MNPQNQSRPSLLTLVRHGDVRALLRYATVGVAQNGVMYAVTLALIWAGLKAWQATVVLYPIATMLSFAANRSWSFDDRKSGRATIVKYVSVYVAMYPLMVGLNWVQEHSGVPSWLASLVSTGIGAVTIFFALNYWVFRR